MSLLEGGHAQQMWRGINDGVNDVAGMTSSDANERPKSGAHPLSLIQSKVAEHYTPERFERGLGAVVVGESSKDKFSNVRRPWRIVGRVNSLSILQDALGRFAGQCFPGCRPLLLETLP